MGYTLDLDSKGHDSDKENCLDAKEVPVYSIDFAKGVGIC